MRYSRLKKSGIAFLLICIASTSLASELDSVAPDRLVAGKGGDISFVFDEIPHNAKLKIYPGGSYIKEQLPLVDVVEDFALHNDFIYLAGRSGLQVVTDIEVKPKIIGTLISDRKLMQLSVSDNKLFAVDDAHQLYVYLLTDPREPELVGEYQAKAAVKSVFSTDSFCYLLLESGEIIVLNTTNPSNIVTDFYLDLEEKFNRLFVSHNTLYAVSNQNVISFVINRVGQLKYRTAYQASSSVSDIVVYQDRAYLALQNGELLLLDVTNPEQWVWLGSHGNLVDIQRLSYNNKKLLAVTNQGTQYLIDVKNPAQPTVENIYSGSSKKWLRAALLDDELSVVLGSGLLQFVDFSSTPPQISNENMDFGQGVNFGGQRRAVIRDNMMYVADWFSGIHLYDISQPDHPQLLSSFHTPGSPKGIVVKGDYAYVADDDYGLQIIDISNPRNPLHVSELITSGLAYTPVLAGDRLFLASHRGGFHIIDISDVKAPKVIAEYDTPGKAWSLAVKDEIVYVSDTTSGLLIFDASNIDEIKQIASFSPGKNAEDILIRGDIAYVAFFDDGLYLLDISNPAQPEVLSHLVTPGNARGLALEGNNLYLADWRAGMHIIDVSDVKQPRITGSYDTRGASWGVKVKNNYAYVLDWWGGLVVLDVSHREVPTLVEEYNQRGIIQQTVTLDQYLIAVSGEGSLQVFDIKNPLHPTWMTTLDSINQASALTLIERVAYVANDSTEITVVDLSDPFNIQLLDTIKLSNKIDSIKNSQGKIYTANYDFGLTVLDPKRAEYQTQYRTGLNDFCLDDSSIYIAVPLKGVLKLDQQTLEVTGHYMANHDISRVESNGSSLFASDMAGKISMFDLESEALIAEYDIARPVVDMLLQKNRLYVTLATQELLVFSYSNKEESLTLDTKYTLNNPVSDITGHQGVLYFSGGKKITAMKPLPELDVSLENGHIFKATIPDNMPEGAYDVVLIDAKGQQQRFHNVFDIKVPLFSKPKISAEKYKDLLQQQLQKNRNLQ